MTCIAWDGKTLAADKRATNSGLPRTVTKIHRVNGCLIGASGDAAQAREMLSWWRNGAKAEDFPASQRDKEDWGTFVVIGDDGIDVYERTPHPIRFEDKQFACGSGRDFATAAMHLGCTAAQAVEIACKFDINCGNGIDTLDLHDTIRAVA